MELIERYIYAVTRRLPLSQRAEAAAKLRSSIDGMLRERASGRQIEDTDVESILLELGNPDDLADKYRGSKRYLIGPELFHSYTTVLKIVMIAVFIAMSVVFIIESLVEPSSMIEHIAGYIMSVIGAATQAFAWVTIGFAIAQYKGVTLNANSGQLEKWSLSSLPPLPDQSKRIKRGEAIAGIVFSLLFLLFFYSSNHVFGVMIFEKGELVNVIPFFNKEQIEQAFAMIFAITAIGILKEALKLIIGKWTTKLALYNLIFNALSLILLIFLFKDGAIWNPTFMQELNEASKTDLTKDTYELFKNIWMQSRAWVMVVFTIILLIDTGSGIYKAYRK